MSAAPGPTTPPAIEVAPLGFTPRAVVLDVDGTLIAEDLVLAPRTRDAVRAAAKAVPVILATGRMYRSALPWAVELQVTCPLVCYQGALIRALPEGSTPGQTLFEEGLDPGAGLAALAVARGHGWHIQAYRDDELICEQDRPEAHLYARIAQVPIRFVDDLEPVIAMGTTKLVCVSDDPVVIDACVAAMKARLGATARVTRSFAQFVELVSPRVNKAAAVGMVCTSLGLSLRDAVAIGDAPNDIEMLRGAGCGVAVRSARPEVLAAAAASCAGPGDAGVADVLEHFALAG